MVCTLLRVTIDTAESGAPELLYDRYPSLIIIVPVILLLLLFSIVSGVKLFQDMICWNREKSSRRYFMFSKVSTTVFPVLN